MKSPQGQEIPASKMSHVCWGRGHWSLAPWYLSTWVDISAASIFLPPLFFFSGLKLFSSTYNSQDRPNCLLFSGFCVWWFLGLEWLPSHLVGVVNSPSSWPPLRAFPCPTSPGRLSTSVLPQWFAQTSILACVTLYCSVFFSSLDCGLFADGIISY